MSIPERPVIDDMPPAPVRGQSFSLFNERANAHAAAQQTLVTQLNAGLNWAELTFGATEQAAQQAQQSAQNAAGSASAAGEARQDAQTARGQTQTLRDQAQTFRNEAEFYANAAADTFDIPALAGQAGNVLTVTPDEQGFGWEEALPPVAAGDVGMALIAKAGGGGEWSGVPESDRYIEFTESGTFYKDPKAKFIYVVCVGGGGAGYLKVVNNTSANNAYAPGGEGGHVCHQLFSASDLPDAFNVVVGSGGASSVAPGASNPGGDSYIHTKTLLAKGGAGGPMSASQFEGSGLLNPTGGPPGGALLGYGGGGGGTGDGSGNGYVRPGGISLGGLGRGGTGYGDGTTKGGDGEFPGGGGGGCKLLTGQGASGAGGDGVVRIWQW